MLTGWGLRRVTGKRQVRRFERGRGQRSKSKQKWALEVAVASLFGLTGVRKEGNFVDLDWNFDGNLSSVRTTSRMGGMGVQG
jgi:hypothetical protein